MSTDFGFKATDAGNYYFISYNTEDAERVAEICRCMNEDGLPIWYDEGIPHDSYWEGILAEKIDHCEEAIFFITKGIFDKGHERELEDIYTYREYRLARIYNKKVLIVMLDQISPKDDVPHELMSWWLDIEPSTRQGVLAFNATPNITKTNIFKEINYSPDKLYTMDDDIKRPLFNSVTNHPTLGDEREFIHIRKGGEKEWKREMEIEAGGQYEVEVFFRNDGNPEYNSSKYDHNTVAVHTRMAIDIPAFVSRSVALTACIMWNPLNQKCIDSIVLRPRDGKSKKIHYVIGQAKIYSKWKANESILPTSLFSFNGTWLGLNELQGVIPAGDEYSGHIKFYIDVERALEDEGVEIICQGSVDGKNWEENSIRVKAGSFITLKTTINNISTENLAGALFFEQIPDNCVLRDSATLFTNVHPSGYRFNATHLLNDGVEIGINKSCFVQIINQIQVNGQIGELIPLICRLTFGDNSISKSYSIELI